MDRPTRGQYLLIGGLASVVVGALPALLVLAAQGDSPSAASSSVSPTPPPAVVRSITPTATLTAPIATAGSVTAPPTTALTPAPSASPLPTPLATTPPVASPQATTTPDVADFSGAWRIIDTVTEGAGAGSTFSFDVRLTQLGSALSGGNLELSITGRVSGNTAAMTFAQPALGYTGSFTWVMGPGRRAQGTFQSSAPNAGTSVLAPLN